MTDSRDSRDSRDSKGDMAPWHVIGRELASPGDHGMAYLALPSKRNPRWIVPLANRAVAWHSLDLYAPSRPLGKLYRCLMRLLTYVPAALQRNRFALDTRDRTNISDYIALQGRGRETYHVAISCGTPSARRKITLQVMNAWGNPQFYLKVGQNPSARHAIQREAAMLGFLAAWHPALAERVPQLICTFEQGADLVLVQRAGPTSYSGNSLTSAHWDFIDDLLCEKYQSFPMDFIHSRNLPVRLQGMKDSLARSDADLLERALHFLLNAPPITVRKCTEHGDFAPWNIRRAGKSAGKHLFVFDWEHGCETGLPMLDALHFVAQVNILVRKASTSRIYDAMRSLPEETGCAAYLARAGVPASHMPYLIAAYLLSVTLDRLEIPETPDTSNIQDARMRCLSHLLQEVE